jgi:hypothetical protein
MCFWATVHEADAGCKGVWPFMIAQLVVLFLMVLFPGTGDDPGKVVWWLDLRRFNTKEGSHDGRQNHDLERTQSEFPGHSRTAYLWLDDA